MWFSGTRPVIWTPWCLLWPSPTSCPRWEAVGWSAGPHGGLGVYCAFVCQTAGGGALALPLLNIQRSELVLRSDIVFLLRQTGLSPDLLLFRDQLDLRALHRAGRLQLTLVDHNVLPR